MANEAYRPMTAQDLIKMYGLDSLIADRKQTKAAVEKIKTLEEVSNSLKDFTETIEQQISDLEDQVDGKISTWFFSGPPSADVEPEVNWTTDEEKATHVGDMYYDQETGDTYTYMYSEGAYIWKKDESGDASEALAKANAAQDTADRKRQIFVVQPYPPYQVGDLWLKEDKDIYRCRAERTAGEFSTTDWKPASDYTNDEYAKGVKAELDSYKEFVAAEYVVRASFETSIDDITARVESNTTKIEEIYNLSKIIEGNPIHITDAGAYDLEKLYLEGNSYQETEPTPDTPQEIEVIEGSVDVEVVGKNLLNIDMFTDNVVPSINGGQNVTANGNTATSYIEIDNSLPLVLSLPQTEKTKYAFYYDENYNFLNYKSNKNQSDLIVSSAIVYSNAKYIRVRVDGLLKTAITEIQLAYSDTAPEYEEHKQTTASLDLQNNFIGRLSFKDTLDVVNGKLMKKVGRVQLNGTETFTREQNTSIGYTRFRIPIENGKGVGLQNRFVVKSTHFKNLTSGHEVGGAFVYQSGLFIYPPADITTLDQLKVWLSENNPIFYYDLAEPYEVQLDTTRIPLFEGINNVNVTTNLDPSYISTTYLTNAKTNAQYATRSQLQLTENSIQSVVKDTTTLNANLTDLQALVGTETTNLKNALGDLSNNLEENYATNNSVLTIENSVSNIQTSLNQQIEITKDIQVNGVSKVKTTTGFTFDENGMTITKTNADTKTNIDEDGMVVYSTTGAENTEILVADAQGVKAENVEVRTYLVVGQNSRFQDYETGTGCFWIGK